jgi:hypothetical protein
VPAPPLAEFHDFFIASVGAAAALIGLLFVAVSIAPEKTFGEAADRLRRADAERAFAALGNIFFVSLAALLPRASLEAIIIIAMLTLIQVCGVALKSWRSRDKGHLRVDFWTQLGLLSVAIYAFQLSLVVRMVFGVNVHDGLIWVVFGLYSYALGTSWMLLGAEKNRKSP